jgi:hypothetical protein
MGYFKQKALALLHFWISFVERYRVTIVVLSVLMTAAAMYYTITNLEMNTSTKDMLSPELSWRKLDSEIENQFPQYTDNILVVVEAASPDQAQDAAAGLYHALQQETNLFTVVYFPNDLPIFRESALLFLDTDELQDLADNLAEMQPFLARLAGDQTIRGLFGMLEEALDAIEDGDDVNIAPLVKQLNLALIAAQHQQPFQVSWQRLMSGDEAPKSVYREFIILQPRLDYSQLLPAEQSIDRIRELAAAMKLGDSFGAKIRLTGTAVLSHEELLSVTQGTEIAFTLALIMITVILYFGLASARLMIATLITLICGLILTAAFATFAVGELNLISVAFTVLYIGLGVDYAIHYCLRYRELRFAGMDNRAAIEESSRNVGGSLFLCAVTTATGFFAFVPTDFKGVAQLGLISGSGIFISLLITITLLPALLGIMPFTSFGKRDLKEVSPRARRLTAFPFTYARSIRVIALLATITLAASLTKVEFDPNTLNIQDPDNESVKTFQDLLANQDTSPWIGSVLADGMDDALRLTEKLERLPLVDKTLWIEDFIPKDQEEKLSIIEEMSLLLGDIPDRSDALPITRADQEAALSRVLDQLTGMQTIGDDHDLLRLKDNLRDYIEYLSIFMPDRQQEQLSILEQSLVASLPERLTSLRRSLNADSVSFETLPAALVERWHNGKDKYLIEVYPRENIEDNDSMRRFVAQIRAADHRIVGPPVVNIEASDAVVRAFQQAFLYSFIAIGILLLFLLDNKSDTLYIIVPLVISAISTGGISVLFNIPFNFANIIALPLILGIGVDSGIHILHRYRSAPPETNNLLATSSARAVVVSAFTTICSIGNLALSPHKGTASMGMLLTIGVFMTLVCMLILLPSMLARIPKTGRDRL